MALLVPLAAVTSGCESGVVAAELGPEGGTLTIPLGRGRVIVEVPPGALGAPARLTGRPVADAIPGAAGFGVELGPHGTTFAKPVFLRFEPGEGDLPGDVPASTLKVATRPAGGAWELLPTDFPAPRTLRGATTHFSLFALVAPCHVAGVGTDFPLTGCAVFNPRIQTSAAVAVNARAGSRTVVFSVGPAGASPPASVQVSLSGLTPNATYYLVSDAGGAELPLPADPAGVVHFVQDTTVRRLLVLMDRPGTVDLDAAGCATVGQWDEGASTCTLTQDILDPPVRVVQDGTTLDCADPVTGQRHVIGGANRSNAGLTVFGRADVRVRNCDIANMDFGILTSGASRVTFQQVTVRASPDAGAGTEAAIVHGQDLLFDGFVADGVETGLTTDDMTGLTVRQSTFRTSSVSAHLFHVEGLVLEDITVDGALSDHLASLPDTDVPLAAIVLEGLSGAQVRRVTGTRLGGYQAALAAVFDADATFSGVQVSGARTGIRLDGPNPSEVSEATLSGNRVGLALLGGTNTVFHNNLFGNSQWHVSSTGPASLWDTRAGSATQGQGNSWGRACPAQLFVAGTDTNRADAVDAHPFGVASAWASGGTPGCALPPPVLTSPVDQSSLNDVRPELAGTATPGATVEVSERGVVLATALAAASGAFAVRPAAPLTEGPHSVTAVARQGAVVSAPSAPARFVVDATAPSAPVIDTPPAGSRLNEASVVVGGTAEPEALVTLTEGTSTQATARTDGEGRFAAAVTLSTGAHTLRATAVDLAGNVSPPSGSVTFTVAAASPSAPLRGQAGKLLVTSVSDAPDPFFPGRGELNELRVQGLLQRSTGAQVGQQYYTRLERVIRDAEGLAVRSIASEAQLPATTGGATPINASVSWDGRFDSGTFARAGEYLSEVTLSIRKGPRPGKSGTIPPDCRSPSLSGPCVLDRIKLVTRVTVASLGPDTSYNHETDPVLTNAQKQALRALAQQSSTPLFVQSWPRAGTVYRLDLEAPSGAPSGATLREHARTFLARNATLWKLQTVNQLSVFDEYPGGDCSAVTFQLQQGGAPVFNATLTVVLTPSGTIRGVTGRMSGEPFAVQPGRLAADGARTILSDATGWPLDEPDLDGPAPVLTATVFDPFFAYDGPHEAQEAFVLNTGTSPGGPRGMSTRVPGGFVVGGASGVVEFSGPSFDPAQTAMAPPKCQYFDATVWAPEIVLDPLTQTPAWVNLHHMRGLKVTGGSDIGRAYAFLQLPQARYLWGDARPTEHLRDGVVTPMEGGTREVAFREYQAGLRVDGAYLSVVLDQRDRVVSALARFVHFPLLPAPGANPMSATAARLLAENHWIAAECGADAACQTHFRDYAAEFPASGELVLLSPAVHEGWAPATAGEQLAYKFEMPRRVIFLDAVGGQVLLDWSTVDRATYGYELWAPPGPSAPPQRGPRLRVIRGLPGYSPRAHGPASGALVIDDPLNLDPDVVPIAGFIDEVDTWFRSEFNWSGIANTGPLNPTEFDVQAYVKWLDDDDNAELEPLVIAFGTLTGPSIEVDAVKLGRNVTAKDVYAHEYMHAITNRTAELADYLEPGALDESYSDLAAMGAAPPVGGGWEFGATTLLAARVGKPLRDLLDPPRGFQGRIAHVGDKHLCNSISDPGRCRHAWVGIPNRAATLIAEGWAGSGAQPFGRQAMLHLYLPTVLPRDENGAQAAEAVALIKSADRFLNQRVKLVERCKLLASLTSPLDGFAAGRLVVDADCDFVGRAFDDVGVEAVRSGVQRFTPGHRPDREIITLHQGLQLENGCSIRERVLTVELAPPQAKGRFQIGSSSQHVPPLAVRYPNSPEWQLQVRGLTTLPASGTTDRTFSYEVETKWFDAPFFVYLDERLIRPPAVATDEECLSRPGTKLVELWSTPIVQRWAPWAEQEHVRVNSGQVSRCRVMRVSGIHQHRGQPANRVHPEQTPYSHGSHGYAASLVPTGDRFALDANLFVRHDWFAGIFARVAYIVEQPRTGAVDFCVAPGTFLAPERVPE